MKKISIDNGTTYIEPAEALEAIGMDAIVNVMDDDLRESVHADLAPCSDLEFLTAYLDRAEEDLIIG